MENNLPVGKPKRKRIARKLEVVSNTEPIAGRLYIQEKVVLRIGEIADMMGVKVYAVGGYVRDYYLKRPRNDFDFTVVGDAIAFANEIARRFKSKAIIYERFGTAMVPLKDVQLEFVGTRKEEYEKGSRNPIVTKGTLDDDIRRRDFTINTMAVALNKDKHGQVIDMFRGKTDLDQRIIKTPLDPTITFSDDPLRMMRMARFAAQLGFKVDHKAITAAATMADRIQIISKERITDELMKIIASPTPSVGFKILREAGLLQYIFPDLDKLAGIEIVQEGDFRYGHKDVFIHSLKVLDNISKVTNDPWLRFAALIHDIAKNVTKKFVEGTGWTFHGHEELGARRVQKIFRYLKLPMEHVNYVETLVRLHQRPMVLVGDGVSDAAVRRLAFRAGEYLEDLFKLCRADITTKNPDLSVKYLQNYEKVAQKVMFVQEKDKLREFQSPVRGDEIMEICRMKPSKAVGLIKASIEEAILDGLIKNNHEEAMEFFMNNKDFWLWLIDKYEDIEIEFLDAGSAPEQPIQEDAEHPEDHEGQD
ncbi:MAG: HD domain-containing protein [Chlorobi bacterium]|nr:HD domain-containing protein [Chlorobiota bacterium]